MAQLRLFGDREPIGVLVVDDDPKVGDIVRRRLRRAQKVNYRVSSVDNAAAMTTVLATGGIDVVLLGVRAENLLGLDRLRRLRMEPTAPAVVVLHHGGEFEGALDAVVTGAQDVLPLSEATSARLDRVIRSAIARKRSEAEILASAMRDPVTGLGSRAWLLQALEVAVDHAATCADGWQVAVLFCDLDRFKIVNDTLGHAKGDELLRFVADRLRRVVRSDDPVARFGGDEFVILLEGHHIEGLAHRIALRALAALSEPFVLDGHEVAVYTSIGLAMHHAGESAVELLEHADVALYRAKRRGRNRVVAFDDELREWSDHQQGLAESLIDDLRGGRLTMQQSTLWDLPARRRVGKVVWPEWGELSSTEALVDVAARNGLGPDLGRWLVETAIADVAGAATEQVTDPPDGSFVAAQRLVVSVPRGVVSQQAFVEWVATVLARHGVEPTQLVIAIDELELADADLVRPVLAGLDELGIGVALSGFGSGSGSLKLFGSDLVDEVHLSADLIDGMSEDLPRRAVVESLVRIADAIGQRVVAVEPSTLEDVDVLAAIGCHGVVTDLDLDASRAAGSAAAADVDDFGPTGPLALR